MKCIYFKIITLLALSTCAVARDDGSTNVSDWSLLKKQITFNNSATFKVDPYTEKVVKRPAPWIIVNFSIDKNSFKIPISIYPDSICYNRLRGDYSADIFYSAKSRPTPYNHYNVKIFFSTAYDCQQSFDQTSNINNCIVINQKPQNTKYLVGIDIIEHVILVTKNDLYKRIKIYIPRTFKELDIPYCNSYYDYGL